MQNLYRKKMPKRTFHQSVVDLLRLSPEQFDEFQTLAKQHLGEGTLHEGIPRPKNKILPSTWRTIADVDSPNTLAAMIHAERGAHNDHTNNFHEGGGLWEGAYSLFNGLWNASGIGPQFQKWFGYDYDAEENLPTDLDRQYAQIVSQSYTSMDDRRDDIGDWHRDVSMDTDRYTVWVDEDDHAIHVGIRGTKAELGDLKSDLHIAYNNTSGNVDDLVEYLQEVAEKYPDWTLDATAHSLGGSELLEAGVNNDLGYDRFNLLNPGMNPFWGLNNAQSAIDDDRFHWYLNTGDMISNGFASMVNDDTHVTWAKPESSPLHNHSVSQWSGTY